MRKISCTFLLLAFLAGCDNENESITSTLSLADQALSSGATYFVSPDGRSTNIGSMASPWDLQTALNGGNPPGKIQPGDSIRLRVGTYVSASSNRTYTTSLKGTWDARIVFKQYQDERAVIDGRLKLNSDAEYLTFWGLEVQQSIHASPFDQYGIESYATGAEFVNLIVHDAEKSGILIPFPPYDLGFPNKIIGSVFYNNGDNNNLDHGVYAQASDEEPGLLVQGNVAFNNRAYGLHAWSEPPQPVLREIDFRGNIVFNNGSISSGGMKGNIIMASAVPAAYHLSADLNVMYYPGAQGNNLTMGTSSANGYVMSAAYNITLGGSRAITVYDWDLPGVGRNKFVGPSVAVELRDPQILNPYFYGNSFYRNPDSAAWVPWYQTIPNGQAKNFYQWQQLTGFDSAFPKDTAISSPYGFNYGLITNPYDSTRAFLWVYNPSGASPVTVSLGSFLTTNQPYKIWNVQNLGAAPISGNYTGGVSLSMVPIPPPAPLGRTTPRQPVPTGPYFNVFLVTK